MIVQPNTLMMMMKAVNHKVIYPMMRIKLELSGLMEEDFIRIIKIELCCIVVE